MVGKINNKMRGNEISNPSKVTLFPKALPTNKLLSKIYIIKLIL